MKKLFATSLMCAAALSMAAASAPQFKWGALLDGTTTAGDQATSLAVSDDGGIYGLYTAGSTDDHLSVMLDNTALFEGSPYSGTSYNNNFCLIRFASDGSAVWNIHTDSGDFASNSGSVSATSDGGCVVMAKVRHTDGYAATPINFVTPSGSRTLEWSAEERYYRLVVLKVSSEGEIEWLVCPEISTAAVNDGCKEFVSEGFNLYAGCVDAGGNVYVPLNLREPMTFGDVTVKPSNVSSWDGDSQKAAGSFVVVKLDSEGNCLGSLAFGGEATATYCHQVVSYGDLLYAVGTAAGSGTLTCGGIEFTPSELNSPVVVSFDSDLTPGWVKCLPGEAVGGKYAVQNLGLTVTNDDVWVYGAFNGKVGDSEGSVESQQGTLREGLLIHLDAADGSWVKGVSSRESTFEPAAANTSLTSYMGVIANPDNAAKIWVYGYGMNAAVGTFIRAYDAETLEGSAEGSWNLVTAGGVPTCQAIAYDAVKGLCYSTTRGNKAFQPLDADLSEAPTGWGVYTASFELPEELRTGVEPVEQSARRIGIRPVDGGIEVVADTSVAVYDLTGRCVYRTSQPTASPVTVSLPAGIYVCAGSKIIVR